MLQTITLTILAGAVASALDLLLGTIAPRWTGTPQSFPPFTLLPVLSGCFGGAILAAIAYSCLKLTTKAPGRNLVFVVAVALALSFLLPIRLSFTRSARFAGVTPSAQVVLMLMHAVVAAVSVVTLTHGELLQSKR